MIHFYKIINKIFGKTKFYSELLMFLQRTINDKTCALYMYIFKLFFSLCLLFLNNYNSFNNYYYFIVKYLHILIKRNICNLCLIIFLRLFCFVNLYLNLGYFFYYIVEPYVSSFMLVNMQDAIVL